jgi:hypothetical protein
MGSTKQMAITFAMHLGMKEKVGKMPAESVTVKGTPVRMRPLQPASKKRNTREPRQDGGVPRVFIGKGCS